MLHLSKGLGLELVEERVLDFISGDRLEAQFKLFQHVDVFRRRSIRWVVLHLELLLSWLPG